MNVLRSDTHGGTLALQMVDRYLRGLDATLDGLQEQREAMAGAIDVLVGCWRRGGTIYTVGNGGSASTATHLAADLAKYTAVEGQPRVRAMSLTDNVPLVSAWTNDAGFGSVYAEQLRAWVREGDVLVAISVHGGSGRPPAGPGGGGAAPWSQNLIHAVEVAREHGAKVLGLSGYDGGELARLADVCLVVPAPDPELGTPLIESVHVVIHHLWAAALAVVIAQAGEAQHGKGA